MKQTAVEFLESQYNFHGELYETAIEQAKEMEKQQMCQFAFDYQDEFFNNYKVAPIEEFYNETFKSE